MDTPNYEAGNFAYGTLAPEEFYADCTLTICENMPKTKSHLKIGNIKILNTHHFSWFHRKMWKLLLGFDIENVEE